MQKADQVEFSGSWGTGDIVYDYSTNLWACCYGAGYLDCSIPATNATFQLPPPQELLAFASSSTSSDTQSSTFSTSSLRTSIPTSSPSHTSSPSPTSSTPPIPSSSSNLSPSPTSSSAPRLYPPSSAASPDASLSNGAKAGIGIASLVLALGLLTAVFCFYKRSHRRERARNSLAVMEYPPVCSYKPRVEMDARSQAGELDSQVKVELD